MTTSKHKDESPRISLKTQTVNVLLDSAKSEFAKLQEDPNVKRALLLQETLRNMQPEEEKTNGVSRENERGKDTDTRIMRDAKQIETDRKTILELIEKHSPITIMELFRKMHSPKNKDLNSESNKHHYKVMYNDVMLHVTNKLINKAGTILTPVVKETIN